MHLSADDLEPLVAQGDIGSNELPGDIKTYPLAESATSGISGSISFAERIKGFALTAIALNGTSDGGVYPAPIHANSAAIGGGSIYTFNSVIGFTGMCTTDTRADAASNSFTSAEVLIVDGYVNVHLSVEALGTLVAQGDIGANFTE